MNQDDFLRALYNLLQQLLKMERYALEISMAVAAPQSIQENFLPSSIGALHSIELTKLIQCRNALSRFTSLELVPKSVVESLFNGSSENLKKDAMELFSLLSISSHQFKIAYMGRLEEVYEDVTQLEKKNAEVLTETLDGTIRRVWEISSMLISAQRALHET